MHMRVSIQPSNVQRYSWTNPHSFQTFSCQEYWRVSSAQSIDSTSSSPEDMGSGPAKMFLTEPDYSAAPVFPTEEHNQGQLLMFTALSGKKSAISLVGWDWSDFPPQIPHWRKALVCPEAWPRSSASFLPYCWGFFSSVYPPFYILVSGPAVGGWLHWLLTKSSGPAAGRQKWMDRPFGLFSCPGFVIVTPLYPLHLVQVTLNLQCDPICVLIKASMYSRWQSKRGNSRWWGLCRFAVQTAISCIPFFIPLHCKMEPLCNHFTHTGVIISTVLLLWCQA